MRYLPASIDPYILTVNAANDYFNSGSNSNRQILNRSYRSYTVNPAFRTLVLLVAGQSLWSNILPTLYVPSNISVVDNFNIFDSNLYDCNGPLLGTTYARELGLGPGNIASRIADKLIVNSKFDRVIIASMAIGSSVISMWATGEYFNRCSITMGRLASRGITPTTPGVTFACVMGLGENDIVNGTTQAAYVSSANTFITNLQNTGFNGRIFWDLESTPGITTPNPVRLAIASLWNGTTVFSGGDFDSIPLSSRQDGVHFNDLGGIQAQNIVISAMAASGSPF